METRQMWRFIEWAMRWQAETPTDLEYAGHIATLRRGDRPLSEAVLSRTLMLVNKHVESFGTGEGEFREAYEMFKEGYYSRQFHERPQPWRSRSSGTNYFGTFSSTTTNATRYGVGSWSNY